MTLPMTAQQLLATAYAEVGTKETAGGRVKYWADLRPSWNGSPWCATFIQWCLKQHGAHFDAELPYFVPSFVSYARARDLWLPKTATPRPGDLVVYGTADHIGWLRGNASLGRIRTIEGNTSSGIIGSQSNGNGVYARTRTRSWVQGFIRLHYKPEPKPTPAVPYQPRHVVSRTLALGVHGRDVQALQSGLNRAFPAYSRLATDGRYGPKTEAVVKEFQRRTHLKVDGRVGPQTRANLAIFGVVLPVVR